MLIKIVTDRSGVVPCGSIFLMPDYFYDLIGFDMYGEEGVVEQDGYLGDGVYEIEDIGL